MSPICFMSEASQPKYISPKGTCLGLLEVAKESHVRVYNMSRYI